MNWFKSNLLLFLRFLRLVSRNPIHLRLLLTMSMYRLHFWYVRIISYTQPTEFWRSGIKIGNVPVTDNDLLLSILHNAKRVPFNEWDSASGYQRNSVLDQRKVRVEDVSQFYELNHDDRTRLQTIIQRMATDLEKTLGLGFRITNTRIWKTAPATPALFSNAWHIDGFPKNTFKLMIYPFGASREGGTTEIERSPGHRQIVEGPPGTFILFKNSEILHRGVAPAGRNDRIIVEISLVPTRTTSCELVFAGQNAMFPFFPWYKLQPEKIRRITNANVGINEPIQRQT